MNNAVFGKTIENVGKHRNIKLVTRERRRNYLVSKLNYHTTKFFTETLLVTEMKKTQLLMSKPACLGLSILDLSETVMYEFWYDYVKPNYGKNTKLSYMDTDSFIVHVKTDNISKDIAEDVETRFDTSNFEIDRPLPKGKKKVSGGKIMKEFVGLRAKKITMIKIKKRKEQRVIKRKLKFQDHKNCLEVVQIERNIKYLEKKKINVDILKEDQKEFVKNNKLISKIQQIFKSEMHNVFTEVINKIPLSSNDDKRMRSIDLIET